MAAGWCRRSAPSGSRPASRTRCGCWGQHAQRTSSRARRARTHGLRSGGGVAAVAPAAAGGRGHAGAVRQGRARRRAGPTAAARGGPRAGAAAAHPAAARRAAGALCQAFMAAPDIRSRPQDWAGRLHESAQLQPPFPRAHRHVLRPMASARLRGAGAGAAGGGDPSPSSRWISATRARPRSQRCSGACWARRPAYLRTDWTLHTTQDPP